MRINKIILVIGVCGALLICGMTAYAFSSQEKPYKSEERAYDVIPTRGDEEPITDEKRNQALEKHLASRIRDLILSIEKIQDCSVSIHIDSVSVAEIILTLRNNEMLSNSDIQSIALLLRGCIPDIEYENIVITDNLNNLYPINAKSELSKTTIDSLSIILDGNEFSSITMTKGDRVTLSVWIEPTDTVLEERVSWSSDDTSIFQVVEFGESGAIITAKHEGTAVLTVHVCGAVAYCIVTVAGPEYKLL